MGVNAPFAVKSKVGFAPGVTPNEVSATFKNAT